MKAPNLPATSQQEQVAQVGGYTLNRAAPVYTGVPNTQVIMDTTDVQQAKVRVWGSWISHLLCAPLASIVYSAKLNNFLPFFAGTGIFLVGIPMAIVDVGITSGIIAPIASAVLVQNKVGEKRRKLGIFSPEEADRMMYPGVVAPVQVQVPVTGNVDTQADNVTES